MDHSMETVSRGGGGGGCSILGLLLFPPVCDHSSMPPPLQIEDVARFVTEQIPRPYRPTLRMSISSLQLSDTGFTRLFFDIALNTVVDALVWMPSKRLRSNPAKAQRNSTDAVLN